MFYCDHFAPLPVPYTFQSDRNGQDVCAVALQCAVGGGVDGHLPLYCYENQRTEAAGRFNFQPRQSE